MVDDITVTDTHPWSQSEPQIYLSLTKYKKDSTNPEVYKQAFLEITFRHPKYMQIYTDGSEVDERLLLQQCHMLLQIVPSLVD